MQTKCEYACKLEFVKVISWLFVQSWIKHEIYSESCILPYATVFHFAFFYIEKTGNSSRLASEMAQNQKH